MRACVLTLGRNKWSVIEDTTNCKKNTILKNIKYEVVLLYVKNFLFKKILGRNKKINSTSSCKIIISSTIVPSITGRRTTLLTFNEKMKGFRKFSFCRYTVAREYTSIRVVDEPRTLIRRYCLHSRTTVSWGPAAIQAGPCDSRPWRVRRRSRDCVSAIPR